MDRSIARFLCLPIFDDPFRGVLRDLKLDHVEFWLAMSDDDFDSADERLTALLPALTHDQDVLDKILVRLEMVNILADMVTRSASRVQAEIASDLGYGSAEPPRVGAKRAACQSIVTVQPPGSFGMMPSGSGSTAQVSSIQDSENSEKKKWGRRLSQICDRAGSAAGINDPARCIGLAPAEAAQLRALAFEAGGFRTIRQNVRNWEKFEEWSAGKGLRVYPPTIVAVMSYASHLSVQGCGPAVLPSFKYAVGWICKRLAMSCPDMGDVRLKALIDRVHSERGKELKEAIPLPPKLVVALEVVLPKLIHEKKNAAAITVWWVLILIYASLRFDDGVHVAPSSLEMTPEALLGVVWQTKVERKKRGTRFAVPTCSISGVEWLSMGWDLFKPYLSDRDYFIWELKSEKEFTEAPVTYSRGLSWLKMLMLKGILEARILELVEVNEVEALEKTVREVTWHSMRVTMLSEAVKARVDDKIVGLQANWKDPSQLVLKYARQRKELSVAMVKSMTEKLRQAWVPDRQHFVVEEEDEDVNEPIVPEFIVKASLPASALSSSDLRCHIFDRRVLEDASVCGRLKLQDAVSVGTQAPGMICQLCRNKAGI